MVVCVVPGCGSDSKKTTNYSFHRLPTSLIRRARWVIALGPISRSSYVCSRHFEANMLMKCGNLVKMLPSAVPKLFLDSQSHRSSSPTEESPHWIECSEEADEESIDELVVCRTCLAAEGRLYAISGSGFEDALASVTGTAMPEAESLPQYLCAFCRAILSKFIAFRDTCQRSTALLESLLENGPLKMNDITAIDRDTHQLSNNLTRIQVYQLGIDPKVEEMPLMKNEINENSDEDTDFVEEEYLDIDVCENNDSDKEYKSSLELPKVKQEDSKNVQFAWERIEKKKDKTEYDDLKIDTDDDMEYDPSDVDTDTSEETLSIRKKVASLKKIPIKKKKTEVRPLTVDIKAFEKEYNVVYECLNEDEQKQEIEERKANNALQYCCDMCGQGHKREYSMVNHLWIHDLRRGPHECSLCRKRYLTTHKLQLHRQMHRDRFTCRECGLASRTRSRAKSHFKEHQGNSHTCPYCNEVYVRKISVYNHIRTRHPEQNVACDECGETFLSALGVRQHKALAHRPITKEILRCKDCDVTFSSAEALQRHEKLGAGVPHAALWPCAACGDSCGSETALAAHAADKHPADQLYCDECDKTFANAASFALHEARKHRLMNIRPFRRKPLTVKRRKPGTGQRKPGTRPRGTSGTGSGAPAAFVCEICGRTLLSAHHLEYHRNVHLGIKPFACPICAKKFTGKFIQQNHMVVHTGERPYQCDHCQQKFSMKNNLERHINNVHFKMKATCHICDKSMGSSSLTDHVRNIHLNATQPRPKRDRKNERKRKRVQSDQSVHIKDKFKPPKKSLKLTAQAVES